MLYEALRATRTHRQRVAAWREIERYVVRDRSYVVPIAGTIQVVPYRTYVKGLVIPAGGRPYAHGLRDGLAGSVGPHPNPLPEERGLSAVPCKGLTKTHM